jgi:RNA binding exosome subunit
MESIYLENNLKLSFEKLPHTIRLIIAKNDEEWVCRKEKLKNLFSFLEFDQQHLFKGRLQLLKSDDKIDIQVKNECVSSISAEVFEQTLNKLK